MEFVYLNQRQTLVFITLQAGYMHTQIYELPALYVLHISLRKSGFFVLLVNLTITAPV